MESGQESLNKHRLSTRALYATLPFDTGQATLFVREKGVSKLSDFTNNEDEKEPEAKRARVSGEEARQFYEDVLLMPKESKTNESRTRRRPSMSRKRTKKRENAPQKHKEEVTSLSQLFLCVQGGDLESTKSALSSGLFDVNAVDNFNWTLLMCASHAGHMTIVRHLLDQGANWDHFADRRGNNAADLARTAGHPDIAELIESYTGAHCLGTFTDSHGDHAHSRTHKDTHKESRRRHCASSDGASRTAQTSRFYCDVCKMNVAVDASNVSRHTTSTVHQFCCGHKPSVTPYGIPESNRGFQLLLKGGWDPERGLGPEQQGQKFPVKTVLKQDRLGFGLSSGRAKPRVTHFSAYDEGAVKTHRERFRKEAKVQPKKKDIVKAAKKDRRWEIRMRRYMNTDYDLPV